MKSLKAIALILFALCSSTAVFAQTDNEAFYQAIESNDTEGVKEMLNGGANPNARDMFQKSALHRAATFSRFDIVETLLKAGADPNIKDKNGYTPLYVAGKLPNLLVMEMLVNHGADIHLTYGQDRQTLLHILAQQNNAYDAVEFLLKKGANPYAKDLKKMTAIDYAKDEGDSRSIVKLLKDRRWKSNK